ADAVRQILTMPPLGAAAVRVRRLEAPPAHAEVIEAVVMDVIELPFAVGVSRQVEQARSLVPSAGADSRTAFAEHVGIQVPFRPLRSFQSEQLIHVPDRTNLSAEDTVVFDRQVLKRNI